MEAENEARGSYRMTIWAQLRVGHCPWCLVRVSTHNDCPQFVDEEIEAQRSYARTYVYKAHLKAGRVSPLGL